MQFYEYYTLYLHSCLVKKTIDNLFFLKGMEFVVGDSGFLYWCHVKVISKYIPLKQ